MESVENYHRLIGERLLNPPIFNAALRLRRGELGLSQQQIAERLNVSEGLFNHIEALRTFPSPQRAKDIAELLQVPGEAIFPQWLRMFTRSRLERIPARIEYAQTEVDNSPCLQYLLQRALEQSAPEPEIPVETRIDLMQAMDRSLTKREIMVLVYRFAGGFTLDEIGEKLNVSRARVYDIESYSLGKLRRTLSMNGRYTEECRWHASPRHTS